MTPYSFGSILRDSQRVRWSIEEALEGVEALDYEKAFLPDSLVHVGRLDFLDPREQVRVNQIRGHSYTQTFSLVERFILPFAMVHAGRSLHASAEELLALMQFGEEEAKHIAVFERFSEAFEFGFGSVCEMVGPPEEIAGSVLAQDPLGVALLVLHIEWMTQDHFLRSVRESHEIDPAFKKLLKLHWTEEVQHAKLDSLIIDRLAADTSPSDRKQSMGAYLSLLESFERVFRQQVELDIEGFVHSGGSLTGKQRDQWREQQTLAYCEAFLRSGTNHPRFREVVGRHFPGSSEVLDALVERWKVLA